MTIEQMRERLTKMILMNAELEDENRKLKQKLRAVVEATDEAKRLIGVQ